MKNRSVSLATVLCLLVLANAVSAATSPTMGTWKLNEAKSKIPAGVVKYTTVVYAPAGDMIKVTTDGVDGSGKPAHTEWTGKFDGKPYPVTGSPAVDSRAVTAKGDRTLEIVNMKDGKSVGTAKVEIAKDGKSRTLETDNADAAGKKVHAKFVYDKE